MALVLIVELMLAEAETGPGGLSAGAWKPYRYGWSAPPDVSEAVAAAMEEDAQASVLEECHRFILSQHSEGTPPMQWRIRSEDGVVLDQGTADEEPSA